MNMEWGDPGPCFHSALDYLQNVDVEFSLIAVRTVAALGNRIVRESGDVRLEARRVQEVAMRKLEPQAQADTELLANRPKLRDQIANLHTTGALPHFRGEPPNTPRPSGLPYDASKTIDMVEKYGMMYGLAEF